jgi:transcriptional pleiotropic regulator of transition state genes
MEKGITRKIDQLGRICLPIDLRRQHNMAVDDLVEVVSTDDGLLITSHEMRCGICTGKNGVQEHRGGLICADCRAFFKKLGK